MYRIIFIFLFGMSVLQKINAQQIFYSQLLQNLYWTLPKTCMVNTSAIDSVVLCCDVIQGDTVPIAFCFDENKVLEHIGYCFLPYGDTATLDNGVIVRFLERELLTLLLTNEIKQTLVTYRENGVSILLNDKPIARTLLQNKRVFFDMLKHCQGITINFIAGKNYDVSFTFENQQKLSFRFPADSELLTGMDKMERDVRLAVQLRNHKAKPDSIVAPDYGYLQLLRDSLYVSKGASFIIPQINNDIFYTKIDSTYSLVFDSCLLAETFSNTLIIPANKDYTIDVTHRMYDNVKEYKLNRRDFDDYFRRDFDRYFGIETLEKEKLTGTLILKDQNAGSIHLAFVSVSLNDLLNGGIMEMQLYSNIPQHNLKTLFGK